MASDKPVDTVLAELRKHAQKRQEFQDDEVSQMSEDDLRRALHELRTHQIELELQNADLRQAQTESLVSQKKYTNLYDFAPIGYLTVNEKGLIIEANLTAAKMLAIERRFLIMMPFSSFLSPKELNDHHICRKKLLETKEIQICEKQIHKKDGSTLEVQCQCTINSEVDGVTGQFRTALTDICERKHKEKQLRQYEAIVASSSDLLALFDKKYKYLAVNQSYLDAFSLTRKELIDKTPLERFGEKFFNTIIKPYADQCLVGEEVIKYNWCDLPGYGHCYMGITFSPYRQDNIIVGYTVRMRDVTDLKLSEEKLDETIQNLHEVARAGKVGLWNWDLKTNKVFFSKEWKRQIGYEDDEIGDDFSELEKRVHPDDLQSKKENIGKSIKEINQEYRLEFRLRHKDGSYRWILAQASFSIDEEGKPIKMLGSHIDITDQKRLEAELHQSQKMESIGMLAGGIAHDFNNILSSVLGYTELALDAVEKETTIAEDLQEVYTAGLRAKDLVNQILTFARQSEENLQPIQIDFIIKEVLRFIRSSIPTTINIKQDIKSDSLIMASATQIHQIIMNLCTNAAQAMENGGGTLEITSKDLSFPSKYSGHLSVKPGDYVEIKISDTGGGIEPHIIGKIFDPYFTTKKPGDGTGMGLALVHGIVETYGGKILVESTPGKGTAFLIYLPIAKTSKAQLHYNTEELPTGQERILLVDDEAQIATIASRILGQLGYSVTTKTDSLDALELFTSKPNDFDLVISDVTMPKITGDQLAQKVLEIRPDIPVILCTGYSKRVSKEKVSKIGIKALAHKPIVKEDFAKTVRKILDEANATTSA